MACQRPTSTLPLCSLAERVSGAQLCFWFSCHGSAVGYPLAAADWVNGCLLAGYLLTVADTLMYDLSRRLPVGLPLWLGRCPESAHPFGPQRHGVWTYRAITTGDP